MQILYPVKDHPMLSPKGKAMASEEEDKFLAHCAMSEFMLKLNETQFTSDDADMAKIASALQVNFQIEQGLDPYINININSAGQFAKGTTFRGYKTPPYVHGQAKRIAETLLRRVLTPYTSARTRD